MAERSAVAHRGAMARSGRVFDQNMAASDPKLDDLLHRPATSASSARYPRACGRTSHLEGVNQPLNLVSIGPFLRLLLADEAKHAQLALGCGAAGVAVAHAALVPSRTPWTVLGWLKTTSRRSSAGSTRLATRLTRSQRSKTSTGTSRCARV
jgi:hypothetical protein